MTNKRPEFDLIVVGAGLVGASFVLALQGLGLRILLLEKQAPLTVPTDARPLSLAYGSVAIFRTLGIWDFLVDEATPILEVEVSEQGSLGAVHFRAAECAVDALGQVVSSATLLSALYQRVGALDTVTVLPIEALEAVDRVDGWTQVRVRTKGGECIYQAPLLVGCDGSLSSVRQLLAMAVVEEKASDVAITATLQLQTPPAYRAYERFTAEGVLAILPLLDKKRCALVMTLSEAVWQERCLWDSATWIGAIHPLLRGRVGPIVHFERGGVFPLQTMVVKEPILPGVVLLGNSAHTLYPLAAQGFNLGLRDAAALAEVLAEARAQGRSLGSLPVLQRYLEWRLRDQEQVQRLTRSIARFFSLHWPGASKARGLGLLAFDLLTPLKRRFASITMGVTGRLPKLMRGALLATTTAKESSYESL